MESLHATEPIRIDDIVLIPIQRVRIETSNGCCGACIQAHAEPRAIVVAGGGRWRALGPDGAEIAPDSLLEEVPGLADIVGAWSGRDA